MANTNTNHKKDPQKKHHLGTVGKKITGGLKLVPTSPLIWMWINTHKYSLLSIPRIPGDWAKLIELSVVRGN